MINEQHLKRIRDKGSCASRRRCAMWSECAAAVQLQSCRGALGAGPARRGQVSAPGLPAAERFPRARRSFVDRIQIELCGRAQHSPGRAAPAALVHRVARTRRASM
ncbi:hypothetical protein EVAR_21601_1 [Eumeta japonica]|uniref:Uncharacterized protein n=1 Tax=Eumeta variegata TaxID=151549 RepID=A0A4C1UXD2_EUMVA|nr:hypothetical protein EVAR_21601_1 [Eumeta japonica]